MFLVFFLSKAEKSSARGEQRCPIRGRHTIFTGTANCDSHFRSSCSSPDVVDIVSTCSSRPGETHNHRLRPVFKKTCNSSKNVKSCFFGFRKKHVKT